MGKLILKDGDKTKELTFAPYHQYQLRKVNDYHNIPDMVRSNLGFDTKGLSWRICEVYSNKGSDRHFIEIRYKDDVEYKQHFNRITVVQKGYENNEDCEVTVDMDAVREKAKVLKAQYDDDLIRAKEKDCRKTQDAKIRNNNLIKLNTELETLLIGWDNNDSTILGRSKNIYPRTWRNLNNGIMIKTTYRAGIELNGTINIELVKALKEI
jgi:hypothetical protein